MKRLNNLKFYIFKSNKTQRIIGMDARIPETKLSAIINGRLNATAKEKESLSNVLGINVKTLFEENNNAFEQRKEMN